MAQSSWKLETEKVSQRFDIFRSQPFVRSAPTSGTTRTQTFSLKEIAARAGVVLRGAQEQLRNVTGLNAAPVLAFDNGTVLYGDRIQSHNPLKQNPTVMPSTGSASNGQVQPVGEANEAAKRAKEFMNPPIAPMDPQGKNEFVTTPEMTNANGENQAQQAAASMKSETEKASDSQFAANSINEKLTPVKNMIAEDGSMNIEDIKKATQVTPGVAVKSDAA